MSLVAYGASSDEDTNSEDEVTNVESSIPENVLEKKVISQVKDSLTECKKTKTITYDEGYIPITTKETYYDVKALQKPQLHLPLPKKTEETENSSDLELHIKLPVPKPYNSSLSVVEVEDEFLHKKAESCVLEKPPIEKKQPVKIVIPSLDQFMDYNVENKKQTSTIISKQSSSLLDMLPKPKHEDITSKTPKTSMYNKNVSDSITNLIPDHVKNRIKKSVRISPLAKNKDEKSLLEADESDEDVVEDFFSLNAKNILPEVSSYEIKAMVDSKVAKITQASKKVDELLNTNLNKNPYETHEESVSQEASINHEALEALIGASHIKRRKLVEEVKIVELSSDQVLPNRSEWMRAALAAETTYQPRGVLVDEEPASGTRKKHQITYLAHQAKANEAELQAMWAANRQNRRATASKYGF